MGHLTIHIGTIWQGTKGTDQVVRSLVSAGGGTELHHIFSNLEILLHQREDQIETELEVLFLDYMESYMLYGK